MKNKIKNCLSTTCIALILLSMTANIYRAQFLCIDTVYQILAANVMIHLVFSLLKQFESKYYFIEIFIEVGSMLLILIISGVIFKWFTSIPVPVLIIMGLATYLIGGLIDIFNIRKDLKFINNQLELSRKR